MTNKKGRGKIQIVQNIEQQTEGEKSMNFDYGKLKKRIKEKFKTQAGFAKAIGWSERTLSLKLSGKIYWKQPEICRAVQLLQLSVQHIPEYFFTQKVQ